MANRLRIARTFLAVLLGAGALILGCSETEKSTNSLPDLPEVMPDFSLADVNPNSATHTQLVSPRNYLGKVSAYYFGHST